MNRKSTSFFVCVFVIFVMFFATLAMAGSKFTNNCGQSAQGLKLAFSGTISTSEIGGSIHPFTQIDAWGPGNGIWLHGGTVPNGGFTECFTYPEGVYVLSAGWTTDDINTALGNALNGENICGIPSLTPWGLIALVVLILGSTVFIMVRRKRAAIPA